VALFEIPDEEGWQDSLAGRIIFVLTGLLLFRMGFQIWASLMPEYLLGAVASVVLFGVGVQLLVMSAMDPSRLDLEQWGPYIAYAVLAAVLVATLIGLHRTWIDVIGTDALLFSHTAAEALAAGQNPYTVDMGPAIEGWRGAQYATPRINGDVVRQLSYPAGSVLWFIPQYLTIGPTHFGLRLTMFVMAIATSAIVIDSLPPKLALAGVAVFLATRNLYLAAAGGVIWPVWMLPMILAIRAWYGERWLQAAFWMGLSAGSKQFAWLILPFLLIWVWKISETPRAFLKRGAKMNAVGGASFLALNGPFILWNPSAWADGVLTPLSTQAPMIHQGAGLAALSFSGVFHAPNWWFELGLGWAMVTALVSYYLYFEKVRWACWIMPPALLFFHYRSLLSYFNTYGVLAVLCAVAVWGRLNVKEPAPTPDPTPTQQEAIADD
jgi:uncharacterized membrane protein